MTCVRAWSNVASVWVMASLLGGCKSQIQMQPDVPLETRRGYCLVETQFKQHQKVLNRESVMHRLAKSRRSAPLVEQGNDYAIGSIVATLAAGTALVVATLAKNGEIEMSDGASTALVAGGVGAAVASWALCITSDGRYVAAAEAYNARLRPTESSDDRTGETLETWR
jgi:hypothetical protein